MELSILLFRENMVWQDFNGEFMYRIEFKLN